METKTESFCVVCVARNLVEHCAYWEIPTNEKALRIAQTVARAAEKFGIPDFDVFVIDIAC